jgi:hypothetical protein
MARLEDSPRIGLPRAWARRIRSAMLHIIALAQYAVTYTRIWAVMGITTGVLFFLRAPLRNHASVAAENLALRQQLGVLRRSVNHSCGHGSLSVQSGAGG